MTFYAHIQTHTVWLVLLLQQVTMGLPQLESCCFVLDLKTGNIVMGCFNAVLSFIVTVSLIVFATTISPEMDIPLDTEEEAALTGLYVMSIILVLMYLVKFIFDVVFVYAIIVERADVIKVCFIMWIVFFLLSMFTFFVNILRYDGWTIFIELFYISVNVYAIVLAQSFYKMLNNREVL